MWSTMSPPSCSAGAAAASGRTPACAGVMAAMRLRQPPAPAHLRRHSSAAGLSAARSAAFGGPQALCASRQHRSSRWARFVAFGQPLPCRSVVHDFLLPACLSHPCKRSTTSNMSRSLYAMSKEHRVTAG